MIKLADNEIHLWFTFPDKITKRHLLTHYQQLLNVKEHQRWQQFHFEKHQHQYLITRALIRTTLSRYLIGVPEQWQFSTNPYGKPALYPEQNLFFNLSNTQTLIICALSRQRKIGIDVETLQHKTSTIDIAQRFFSRQEAEDLLNCPKSQQQQRFFQYWTLKEAYIKACGRGLSQALTQFSLSIDEEKKRLTLGFDASLNENPKHWSCWLLQVSSEHYAALCIFNPTGIIYKLQAKEVIPLEKESVFDYKLLAMS